MKHSSKPSSPDSKTFRGEVSAKCQGPCQQGRKECPIPWACETELDQMPSGHTPWDEIKADLLLAIVITVFVLAIAMAIALFL